MKLAQFRFIATVTLITASSAYCQKNPQEKPKFGFFQCRADAQKWTFDPFDKTLDPKFQAGAAILVNGQFRTLPHLTYGVTVGSLLQRAYEMDVCKREDPDFEKQFATYSSIEDSYREERTFRYMSFLTKHHLDEQFAKEDIEDFK
jgi:hypothetical protein